MFTEWMLTDDDCCQHIRRDGSEYELIQYVWLDTTSEDIAQGRHEYCIVKTELNIDTADKEDIDGVLSMYGYEYEKLFEDFGINGARDLIAECLMEDDALQDCNVIADANTQEEAEAFINNYIKE